MTRFTPGVVVVLALNLARQAPAQTLDPAQVASTVVHEELATDDPNILIGISASGQAVRYRGTDTETVLRFATSQKPILVETLDEDGNRTLIARDGGNRPTEIRHSVRAFGDWFERFAYDAAGETVLRAIEGHDSTLAPRATQLGISLAWPDWIEVQLAGVRTLEELRVYTLQDDFHNGIDPDTHQGLEFNYYGVTDYEWLYRNPLGNWTAVPGGYRYGNRSVRSAVHVAPFSTSALRLVVHGGRQGYSRVVEIEAIESTTGANVAAASSGARITGASSTHESGRFPAAAVIDGDRAGASWGSGGGWNDATPDTSVPGAPALPAATSALQPSEPQFLIVRHANAFASVTRWSNNADVPAVVPLGAPWHLLARDTTQVMGKEFTATLYKTFAGTEAWDSHGAGYVRVFDTSGYLSYVADELGDIVRIVRDEQHRPIGVFIGSAAYIHYQYDASGHLLGKYFVNRDTDEIFYRVDRTKIGHETSYYPSRRVTEAILPGHGTVIEWDEDVGPGGGNGYIVASLEGEPYALIPTQPITVPLYDNNRPIRRIINLFSEQDDPLLRERIEFNAEQIVLQLRTGAEKPFAAEHRTAFSFPRFWSTAASQSGAAVASRALSRRASAAQTGGSETGLKIADGGQDNPFTGEITVIADACSDDICRWILFAPNPGGSGVVPGGGGGGGRDDTKPECRNPEGELVDCNCQDASGNLTQYCPCETKASEGCGRYPNCAPLETEKLQRIQDAFPSARAMLSSDVCLNVMKGAGLRANQDLNAKLDNAKFIDGVGCREPSVFGDAFICYSATNPRGHHGAFYWSGFEIAICEVEGLENQDAEWRNQRNALRIVHELSHMGGAKDVPSSREYGRRLCMACAPALQGKCDDLYDD